MKILITLITLFFYVAIFAQTDADVQGTWYYQNATFSGTDAASMTDDQKTPPCKEQFSMSFNKGTATLTNASEPDCSELETKSVPYRVEEEFIILSVNQSERKMKIHSFSKESIVLIPYIGDQNLTIKMTMVKK